VKLPRPLYLTLLATLGLALAVLLAPELALADTSDVGRNVGREIRTWATAILLGVAALVAIPVIAKRDVNGGLVLVLLVVLVGGFAFASGTVRSVISELWQAIGG
jgi:cobalamin synthase